MNANFAVPGSFPFFIDHGIWNLYDSECESELQK